jgi:hypothetical protein
MNVKEKIEKLFTKGYKDNHRGWFGAVDDNVYIPDKVVVLIRYLDFEEPEVCFSTDKGYYSLNPFYYDEKEDIMRLSTMSIGSCVNSSIEKHNKEMGYNNTESYHSVEHIVEIYRDAWLKREERKKELEEKYGKAG